MRRDVRILLATAVLGAVATAIPMLSDALSRMETFRISDVEVRGLRFLTEDSVIARLQLRPESSVWTDTGVWAERIVSHPLIRSVEVRRKVPGGLLIMVEERFPVALAATPTLEPVDAEGYRLPIDPSRYRLDLPVISADRTPPNESQLFPEDVRVLVAAISHLMNSDAAFVQRVSTLRQGGRGSFIARLTRPEVDFLLEPGTSAVRLKEGQAALNDAMSKNPGEVPAAIDLRFREQVVVRRSREED